MAIIKIRRSDDYSIYVTYQANGSPVNLTNSTVFFTVKAQASDNAADDPTDAGALIKVNVTSHTQPLLGKTVIVLPSSTTNVNAGTDYVYDIQVKDSTGGITTIDEGTFIVVPDVTRRNS